MNIDRGCVSYGDAMRVRRTSDYQHDGCDAAVFTPRGLVDSQGRHAMRRVPASTALIPDNAAATIPSINPPPISDAAVSPMQRFNCWIDDNPILAVAGLAALFFIFRGGKK